MSYELAIVTLEMAGLQSRRDRLYVVNCSCGSGVVQHKIQTCRQTRSAQSPRRIWGHDHTRFVLEECSTRKLVEVIRL